MMAANVIEFRYVGPMPEGYELRVVHHHPDTNPRLVAQRIDGEWHGAWRHLHEGLLAVGDAWKHVTNAQPAEAR